MRSERRQGRAPGLAEGMSPIVEHPGRAAQSSHHEGAHRCGAGDLLHDGGGLDRAHRDGDETRAGKRTSARRC